MITLLYPQVGWTPVSTIQVPVINSLVNALGDVCNIKIAAQRSVIIEV